MTIEKVEHQEGKSIFSLYEPTRYGKADIHRVIEVSHKEIEKLDSITYEEIEKLPHDYRDEDVQGVDFYADLPTGDRLVFILVLDLDGINYSNTYRAGAYSIRGPYRVIKK